MNFLAKISYTHGVIKQAWSLMWHKKLLFVYVAILYSAYAYLAWQLRGFSDISLTPCCRCAFHACGLHMVSFIIAFCITNWIFVAFINQILAVLKNVHLSFIQSFVIDLNKLMVVGCLAFVALVLYAINFYLQATVFFALGLVLLTLWGIFSFYALVEILNQPRTLSAIFKRAPSALWSILLPLIIVILELYIGFVCMIALIVLLILCIFWLGKYFHVVNLSFSTGMNMLPQLLLLLKSPFAIITFVVGGLLLVSTLLLWVTLVLVATVVLYYSAIKQLNSW